MQKGSSWILTQYHLYKKKSSKCVKDLNVRTKDIKLLEENIEGNFQNIEFCNNFLAMTPMIGNKRKNKIDFTEIKNFYASKDTIKRVGGEGNLENVRKKNLQFIHLIRD